MLFDRDVITKQEEKALTCLGEWGAKRLPRDPAVPCTLSALCAVASPWLKVPLGTPLPSLSASSSSLHVSVLSYDWLMR